jgi:hypothetical protein
VRRRLQHANIAHYRETELLPKPSALADDRANLTRFKRLVRASLGVAQGCIF